MKTVFKLILSSAFLTIGFTNYAQTGNVFNDLNGNGVKNVGEPGVQGIVIKSYTQTESLLSVAISDSLGNYTLSVSATSGQKIRVEFSIPNTMNFYKSSFNGTAYGSSVQFVTGNVNNINYAVCNPSKSVNNDPILIHSRFTFGNQIIGEYKDTCVLFGVKNSWGTNSTTSGDYSTWNTNSPLRIAFAKEIGSVYGVVYSKKRNLIYTSAFFRQFNGFGPNGPGAIYKIPYNYNTGLRTANPSLMVDVASLSGQSMPADPHGTDIPTFWSTAPVSTDARMAMVTKYSLGDLEMSDDESKLYTINLFNREIVAINPDNGALIGKWAVPTTGLTNTLGTVNASDVRPFALGYKNGKLYVGAVSTGQSTQVSNGTASGVQGNVNAVHAYVWELNESTNTFKLVLNFKLNNSTNNFYTWQDKWNNGVRLIQPWGGTVNVAQPILSDIDFYGDDMILGFRNRANDQRGINLDDATIGYAAYTNKWGDIIGARYLHATGTYLVESAGKIGSRIATGFSGVDAGYDEFYRGDGATNGYSSGEGFECATGAFVQVGGGSLASLQNFPSFSFNAWPDGDHGGVTWMNNQNGNAVKGYTSFLGDLWTCPSGKTNGMGSIEAVTETMPIEVGNRVWYDADGNGIQSSNENGYANVVLEFLDASGNIVLGTTQTNTTGYYIFNNSNVPGGIKPNTTYKIRIHNAQYSTSGGWGALAGVTLTSSNMPTIGMSGVSDNDGVNASGLAMITFTTGELGENNHDLDFGLKSNLLATSNMTSFTTVKRNNEVLVQWVTTSETDLAVFEIERSLDGINWIRIGSVNGSVNSSTEKNYSFIDRNPILSKVNLYRLKQVGSDNKFSYSVVKSVKFNTNAEITLFPNPAKNKTTLNFPTTLQGEQLSIKIISANGQVAKQINFTRVSTQEIINVDDLISGFYQVVISNKMSILQSVKLQIIN